MPAQAIGLGRELPSDSKLKPCKGATNWPIDVGGQTLVAPLRGLKTAIARRVPWPLAWADMFGAYGVQA